MSSWGFVIEQLAHDDEEQRRHWRHRQQRRQAARETAALRERRLAEDAAPSRTRPAAARGLGAEGTAAR